MPGFSKSFHWLQIVFCTNNVLNLRASLASVPYGMRAIRLPDDERDTLKKLTKVCTKYNKRFQSLSLPHTDESIMKEVSIGIGHTAPVRGDKIALTFPKTDEQAIYQSSCTPIYVQKS